MAVVIHTIKGNQYAYNHHREGKKVVCDYLGREGGGENINKGTMQYKEQDPQVTQQHSRTNELLLISEKITDEKELSSIGLELAKEVSQGKIERIELYKDTDNAIGRFADGVVYVEPNTDLTSSVAWNPAPEGKDPITGGEFLQSNRKVPQMVETAIHEGYHQRFVNNSAKGHEAINKLKKLNYGGDEFEGLIRLATFYTISPEQLKKESPEQYKIIREWID